MALLSHFVRYSKKEDVVTNNTMQLFNYILSESYSLFNKIFISIFEEENFIIGPKTYLQTKSGKTGTVPDAEILQSPIRIIFETKIDSNFKNTQLEGHIDKFDSNYANFFITLDRYDLDSKITNVILDKIKKSKKNITHKHITFSYLIETIKNITPKYYDNLHFIVDDFSKFCQENDLVDDRWKWLRVLLCGQTLDDNVKYGVYYKSNDAILSGFQWVGLYSSKTIKYIAEVKATVRAPLYTNKLDDIKITEENISWGDLAYAKSRKYDLIKSIKESTKIWGNALFDKPHNFLLLSDFKEVNFIKTSKYAIMNTKYFDINSDFSIEKAKASTEEISNYMNKIKTWE